MFTVSRPRKPGLVVALLVLVTAVGSLSFGAASASASEAAIVIPFQKWSIGPGQYVGTAGDGGTIAMQVYDSYVTGNVQHFTASLELMLDGRSLSAVLDGRFNFSTAAVTLNGIVTDGWLECAQVHEESQLVDFDPLTFTGTVQLMPAST